MLIRFVRLFNRLFVLWVVMGGLLAYNFPRFILPFKPYMELIFAVTMFGVGMVLQPRDFIAIWKNLKIVVLGVLSQFSIMPVSAYVISKLFAFSDEFSLGLILAGSAPGAMASNVLCYLAGADVAYSVSLTTASTLLAPVLTPLLTLTLAHTLLEIPFFDLFVSVLWMVVGPLFLGLAVRRFAAERIDPFVRIFPAISTLFIAFICALVIALNRSYLSKMNTWIFLAVILLNVIGLLAGYLVGHLARFDLLKKRALSIEIGMQNAGLGSVLAVKHFNERVALPAVIFVFICIFSAALLVQIWSRNSDRTRPESG
jgi:BASS family bile acid:Na+ symporter